ncbi:MAG: GTPase HflX [Verrucomicrobiota bacterium]|nr:GTPase HflX [Verrucomicrobiota bacterium]
MFEVKEKPRLVEKAYLLAVILREEERAHAESLLEELEELVSNLGIKIFSKKVVRVRKTYAGYLLGKGKFNEVIGDVRKLGCDVIIFDNELSPSQQRNWEAESKVLVIDRQEIILDVFAARAQTKEAVLQVKLARLEYSLPRLRRAWTHLGRQRGGGVTQRGEGEAQIELDQRLVRDQISATKKEIKQVVKTRKTSRKRRLRIPLPTVALVGYTNAGKSTLLNQVCDADVLSADKLFATLDPTSRQSLLPNGEKIILTDTVGFIRKLPHRLVDAFRATLEETLVANLLLHVVDLSNPQFEEHMETTLTVLGELGAKEKEILTVFNKVDLLKENELVNLKISQNYKDGDMIYLSCKSGEGIYDLLELIESKLGLKKEPISYHIPHNKYSLVVKIRNEGCLAKESAEENGMLITAYPSSRLKKELKGFEVSC